MSWARGDPFVKIGLVVSYAAQPELDEFGAVPRDAPLFECGATEREVGCGLIGCEDFGHVVISGKEWIVAG